MKNTFFPHVLGFIVILLGTAGFASALTIEVSTPEELVRAHAAWALGQLGGTAARQALEASLPRESGVRAKEEILSAIGKA